MLQAETVSQAAPSLFHWSSPVEFWTMIGAVGDAVAALVAIAVLVVAVIGLRSLKLAQSDMVTRAQRDSLTAAIERSQEFADEIIPTRREIRAAFAAANQTLFVGDASKVTFNGIGESSQVKAAQAYTEAMPAELRQLCFRFLNRLEVWAMYFVKELADGEVALNPCAPIFVSTVIEMYPLIVVTRATDSRGDYPNLVALFGLWDKALSHAKKTIRAQELLEEAERLMEEAESAAPALPRPIGTSID